MPPYRAPAVPLARRPEDANATFAQRLKDYGIDIANAVIGAGEGAVGLADIPTMGAAGKLLHQATGYDPSAARRLLSEGYSDERKYEQQETSRRFRDEGILSGLGYALRNPAVPIGTITESLPLMLGGRGIAQGAVKAFKGISPVVAGALGEGLITAGSQLEQIRQQSPDQTLTPFGYGAGMVSGAATAALGYGAGRVAQKLGLADIDIPGQPVAEAVKAGAKKGILRRISEGMLTEGLLEELPQSAQEQIAVNLATGKPWDEGVTEAAGMGMLTGSLMGGVMQGVEGVKYKTLNALASHDKIDIEEAQIVTEEAEKLAATRSASVANHEGGVVDGKASLSLLDDATSVDERARDGEISIAAEEAKAGIVATQQEAQALRQSVDQSLQAEGEAQQAAALETSLAPMRAAVGAGEEFAGMVLSLANNSRTLSDFTKQMGAIYGQKGINAAAGAWKTVQQTVAEMTRQVAEGQRLHTEDDRLAGLIAKNRRMVFPQDTTEKIVTGQKTHISAAKAIPSGEYALPDGTILNVAGVPEPVMISDLNDPEAWARGEGYESVADAFEKTKYSRIKSFINGTGSLYIAQVVGVDESYTPKVKRRKIIESTSNARAKMVGREMDKRSAETDKPAREMIRSEGMDDFGNFLTADGKTLPASAIEKYEIAEIEDENGKPDKHLIMVSLTTKNGETSQPKIVTRYDFRRHLKGKNEKSAEDIMKRIRVHKEMRPGVIATDKVFPPAEEEAAIARRKKFAKEIRDEIYGIYEAKADTAADLSEFESMEGALEGIDALRQPEEAVPYEELEEEETPAAGRVEVDVYSPERLAFMRAQERFRKLRKQSRKEKQEGLSITTSQKIKESLEIMNNNPVLRGGYSDYIAGLLEQAAKQYTVESIVDFIKDQEGDIRYGRPLISLAELNGVPDSLEDLLVFMHETENVEDVAVEEDEDIRTLFGESLGAVERGQQTLTEQVLEKDLPRLSSYDPEILPVIRRKAQRAEQREAVKQDFYDVFRKIGALKNKFLTDETVIAGFFRGIGKLASEGYSAKARVFDPLRVVYSMNADPLVSPDFKFKKQIVQASGKIVGEERPVAEQMELVETLWRELTLAHGFYEPSKLKEEDYGHFNAEIIDIIKDAGGMVTQDIDADLRQMAVIEMETQRHGRVNMINLSGSNYWTLEAVGKVTYQTRDGKKTIKNPTQEELNLIAEIDPAYVVDEVRGFTYDGDKRADIPYVKKNELQAEIAKINVQNDGAAVHVSDKSYAQVESQIVHALVKKDDGKAEPINMTVADVVRHRRRFGKDSVEVAKTQPEEGADEKPKNKPAALYPVRIKLVKPDENGKRWRGATLRPDQINTLIEKAGIGNVVFVKPGEDPKRAEDRLKDKEHGLVVRSQLPARQVYPFTQSTSMEPMIEMALGISAALESQKKKPLVTQAEVDEYTIDVEAEKTLSATISAVAAGEKEALVKQKETLTAKIDAFETKIKSSLLAQKMRGRLFSDPDVFEKFAKKYPIKGWTAKNYFDLYSKVGEVWPFVAQVRKLSFESSEKQLRSDIRAGKLEIQDVKDDKLHQAISVALLNDEAYQKFLSDKKAADEALTKIVDLKNENGLQIVTTEIFESNRQADPRSTKNGFEQELIDKNPQLTIGRMRDKKAQAFYKAVAKIFGADLVIVSGMGYQSRYLSKASDGRAKIIINIDSPTAFHRIYGHEIFHHVVWKSNPAQYAAFKQAVMATLGEDEYYQAVNRVHAQRGITEMIRIPEGTTDRVAYMLGQLKEKGISEEEFMAELMATVVHEQGFYAALSQSFVGQTLAQKIIKWLIERVGQIVGVLNAHQDGWSYAHGLLYSQQQQRKLNDLFASFVGAALQNTETEGVAIERFNTPFGRESIERLEEITRNSQGWLQGLWKKIFPNGTKTRKDVMTGLENLLKSIVQWIGDHKPKMIFADLFADGKVVDMMKELVFGANKHVSRLRYNIKLKGYDKLFRAMSQEDQMRFHDVFVRGLLTTYRYTDDNGKLASVLRKSQLPMGAKATRVVKDIGTLDISAADAKERAKQLGFNPEVITALADFRQAADLIFKELEVLYPGLEKRVNDNGESIHYGQSIKWHRKHGSDVDFTEDWDTPIGVSRLEGDKRFLKEKSEGMTTEEIAEKHNLEFETLDPVELLLGYAQDAYKLSYFHRIVARALKHGYAKIFTSTGQAMYAGFHPVNDNALRIMQNLSLPSGYKILLGKDGDGAEVFYRYPDRDANGNPIRAQEAIFSSEEEAEAVLASLAHEGKAGATIVEIPVDRQAKISGYRIKLKKPDGEVTVLRSGFGMNQKKEVEALVEKIQDELDQRNPKKLAAKTFTVYSEPILKGGADTQVAQIYFHKDMARMLNTVLAPDRIRRHAFGRKAMNIKNQLTSIEFMLSMFHAMTIGQELISSNSTWSIMRQRQNTGKAGLGQTLKSYLPWTAVREAKEIAALMEAVLADRELANHPEVIAKAKELFNTDSADVVDAVIQFYDAGGLLGLDKGLHSDLQKQGEMRYKDGQAEVKIIDGKLQINLPKGDAMPLPLRFLGKHAPISRKAIAESMKEVLDKELADNPDSKLTAYVKTGKFALLEGTTAWLMEQGIPRIKMAMFAREYTLELDRNRAKIDAGQMTRSQVAYDVMKFIEDRFGEVNWQNLWLEPTYKTALQFLFRSFTWFTGSWTAAAKSGFDLVRVGWLKVKGEEAELTPKGVWGLNAVAAHMMAVGLVYSAYMLQAAGGDEVEDEETPLLTRMLFPRVDALDPGKRVMIPSYVSEWYKMARHLGIIGHEFEPAKLISGRFNSILGKGVDVFWTNQDFRGVTIRDHADSLPEQIFDALYHMMPVPISVSSALKSSKTKGFDPFDVAIAGFGITDAPAAAKRSEAANVAFEIRRKEYKGREISADEMELKDDVKRAAYAYGKGDTEPLRTMLSEKKISRKQYENALTRIPLINGKPNPRYVDPLTSALKGLTIKGAIKVWGHMTDVEKASHRRMIMEKYHNMLQRSHQSPEYKQEVFKEMRESGILGR